MKRILFAGLLAITIGALAHPGGLNGEGCHNNRKTGDYHCHRAKSSSAATDSTANAKPQRPAQSDGAPVCHIGPRGGTYTITPSGRKNYRGC